jgi:PleD family two-component response regulator
MTEPNRLAGPSLVLVAGEREGTARWLEGILAPHGFAVFQAVNGRHALARAHGTQPDAIFMDAVLPDMSGLELCRLLREDPRVTPATPLLITTPHVPTREQRLAALRAGAWDCIGRATDPDELVLKLEAAMRAKLDADRARAEGLVDPGSGLYNRQGVARRAVELGSQAFRQRSALACVVFAVDLEPAAATGEAAAAAIVRCVQVLKATGRVSDVVGRLGPTEFAVLAPATDRVGATKLAQRLVGAIEAPAVRGQPGPPLRVRAGLEAVGNVGYAPIKPMDLLIRASAALRRGTPVDGSSAIRRYDEGGSARPS